MIRGIVKSWNISQGWGVIQRGDGEYYFIHTSKVRIGRTISKIFQVKLNVS